jgi:hypothetical protein
MGTRIVDAWNGWYHLNGNTYGTWIRGDERGWRARHHREHVDGDYKHPPPPEEHAEERNASRKLMGDAVRLSAEARRVACGVIVESLLHQKVEVIACALDDHHYHVLARFRMPRPLPVDAAWLVKTRHQPIYAYVRHVFGLAKSRSTRALSGSGLVPEGGVWSKRFKITPVSDRAHQVAVYRYILRHGTRRAATWRVGDDPE